MYSVLIAFVLHFGYWNFFSLGILGPVFFDMSPSVLEKFLLSVWFNKTSSWFLAFPRCTTYSYPPDLEIAVLPITGS